MLHNQAGYPQELYRTWPGFNAIEIQTFPDPQIFGDRKLVRNGAIYTSRNPVRLKDEGVFFCLVPR